MSHLEPPPSSDPRGGRGLLESIADTALDDDYYEVRPGRYSRGRGLGTVATATAVMLLALMITIAAVQTRTDRPVDELERDALIADIGIRKQLLAEGREKTDELQSQVVGLRDSAESREFDSLRVLTAQSGAVGPGVRITLDNGPATIEDSLVTEQDLQILVNGLWYAGTEAVSINGNRLSSLSAIGRSGQALTVNYRSLTRPYTVIALGNAGQLADRISSNTGGQYWAGREVGS